MSINHTLDDREHGLRALLTAEQFKTAHIPVGDIWIGIEEGVDNGLIIERKSAADLEASILDGRYREQRVRLLSYAAEKKAHPVYIIEGSLDRFGARLKQPALMKHLTRLAIRYKVSVFQTGSIKETAELCKLLADQWATDPTTFQVPTNLSYVESRGVTKGANSDDPKVFATSVLGCCRGISTAGALAVLEGCGGSLSGVWEASEAALAAVQVGKQKLGAVKAKRLWGLLHSGVSEAAV
jgi:ERCC4-type nuclease